MREQLNHPEVCSTLQKLNISEFILSYDATSDKLVVECYNKFKM